MDIFDEYIVGNLSNINWCFENTHFVQRLDDNGISREYIVDTILNEEPLRYEPSGNHQYEVIFPPISPEIIKIWKKRNRKLIQKERNFIKSVF